MAKEKQTRRMIAMALAAAVTMSSIPAVAFAEDGVESGATTETTGPTTTGENTKENPTLTVTVTVHKNEDTTTTVEKTETDWHQQLTQDTTVDFDGEKVNTTVRETVPAAEDSDATGEETGADEPAPTEGSNVSEGGEAPAEPQGEVIREHETTDDTTTTVQTTEDGTTTKIENVQTETGTREDGTIVDREVTNTQVTKTDSEGNIVEGYETEEGYEELQKTTENDPGDGDQPDVEVKLEVGKTTSQAVTSTTTTTGDVPIFDFSEESENAEYTVIEEVERTVTATTSEIKVTVNDPNAEDGLVGEQETDMEGLAPVYDYVQEKDADGNPVFDADGKPVYKQQVDKNGKPVFDKNGNPVYVKEDKGGMFDYQFNSGLTSKYANPANWNMPEGADVRYVGTGEHSKYYVATAYVEYEKDAEGNTIYDEKGNPVIKEIRRYSGENNPIITIDGKPVTELPDGVNLVPEYDNYGGSRPFIFALMDQDKNTYYAYCCDLETGTADGWWYSVSNLEDSNYYASKESADHIRSIVMNGYWGTSGIPKEDGSYNTGSLEKIKADMKAAIANGDMDEEYFELPDLDADGKPVVNEETGEAVMREWSMTELIDHLTDGEALLATQAAIWSFANGSYDVMNGKDGSIVLDPDGYKWNHNPNGNSKAGEAMTDYSSAAVDFMYKWLIGLETEEESTVVVNEKNFVEDMSLVVRDKVEGHEDNLDDNVDNDVYDTELNFKLAFVPGENDDLLVQVTYTDMDGVEQNVVRRLAGENAEGQTYEGIKPEDDGSYVIKGLQLSENEDFNFDLRLEGTQYLEQGVYVYAPVGGRDVSQTFVGIAEGERNVDVSMGVTVSFDVDENDRVVARREWSKDSRHSNSGGGSDPKDPTPDPEDPNPTPDPEDPGMTIEDEDVPLADAPVDEEGMVLGAEDVADAEDEGMVLGAEDELIAATGDSNHMTAGFGGMLAALAGMFMLRKKKEN